MCPASSCVAIVGIPVPLPLAIGPIDSQSQHVLRVGSQPPRPRQLEPFLNQIAVRTLNLAGANRQTLADGPLVVQLVLTLTQVAVAAAHGGVFIKGLWRLQVRLQLV